jgi:hypothetical protein
LKFFLLSFLLVPVIMVAQTQYRLNVNNINLPLDTKGILAAVNIPDPNPSVGGSGGKFGGHVFLFSGGFLLAGYANDTLWANGVASASLVTDYLPGTVNNEPSDPKNIIYVVKNSDSDFGQSWQDWINAVSLGADFYDGNNDCIYNPIDLNGNNIWDPSEDKPALIGDVMTWCVYNDEVPANQRRYDTVTPKGIEIQQTVAAYASTQAPLGNTIFIRYRLINTGTVVNKLDSVIFAMYADPDLGEAQDDLIGCDTLLSSGFVYNSGPDGEYGSNPPAFYTKFLQGPVTYIPGETFIDNNSNNIFDFGIDTALDTAYNRRGGDFSKEFFVGAKNLGVSSSTVLINGDPTLTDPDDFLEAANYLNGFNRTGGIINPCTFTFGAVNGGVNCSEVNPAFWFSGDPVSNIGWIESVAGDIRNIVSTGKFTLESGKPIDIWVAYIVGQGNSALNSITLTKNYAQNVQTYFNNNFTNGTVSDVDDFTIVTEYNLSQNYPNPFNPITKISWQSPVSSHQTLKVYDVLGNEVATLVNEFKPAGSYNVQITMNNLASGIYFYRLTAGSFVQTKKMILMK